MRIEKVLTSVLQRRLTDLRDTPEHVPSRVEFGVAIHGEL